MSAASLIFVLAAAAGSVESSDSVPTVERKDAMVAGVGLEVSSEAALGRVFGSPVRVESFRDEAADAPAKEITFQGVTVYLVGDKVYRLSCTMPRYRTPAGVHVGNREDEVVAKYGRGDSVSTVAGRFLRYNIKGSDCWMDFRIKDGRVAEILLWFDYV